MPRVLQGIVHLPWASRWYKMLSVLTTNFPLAAALFPLIKYQWEGIKNKTKQKNGTWKCHSNTHTWTIICQDYGVWVKLDLIQFVSVNRSLVFRYYSYHPTGWMKCILSGPKLQNTKHILKQKLRWHPNPATPQYDTIRKHPKHTVLYSMLHSLHGSCIGRLWRTVYSSGHWVLSGYDCVQWFENWDRGTDKKRERAIQQDSERVVCCVYEA